MLLAQPYGESARNACSTSAALPLTPLSLLGLRQWPPPEVDAEQVGDDIGDEEATGDAERRTPLRTETVRQHKERAKVQKAPIPITSQR
jgi:hypothetical protein